MAAQYRCIKICHLWNCLLPLSKESWYFVKSQMPMAKERFTSLLIENPSPRTDVNALFHEDLGSRALLAHYSAIPSLWHSFSLARMVAKAVTVLTTFYWRKDKEGGSKEQVPVVLKMIFGSCHRTLILPSYWPELSMWLHLAAREARKLSILDCHMFSYMLGILGGKRKELMGMNNSFCLIRFFLSWYANNVKISFFCCCLVWFFGGY